MPEKNNALADLAVDLYNLRWHLELQNDIDVVDTAQHIVAELAKVLDTLSALSKDDEKLREAAARLRKVTVRSDNSSVIAELQRRLKVAEDALYGLLEIVCDDCKSPYRVDGKCVKCPRVQAAEAALAKASGESEVKE